MLRTSVPRMGEVLIRQKKGGIRVDAAPKRMR